MRIHALTITMMLATTARAQAPAPQATPPAPAMPSCPELSLALTRVVANDMRVRDWPNLARYREANRTLPPTDAASRVVFMGDSITDAWQQPRFGGFFQGKPYIDRGISGQTTPQMLLRFRRDVIDLHPKAVVILAGTNDIANNTGTVSDEEIEGNLASMSELARAHGIKVVLASITPVSEYHVAPAGIPQTTSRPMSRIRAINEWMKGYASANGFVYLDYYSSMIDEKGLLREDLSADDLHPTAKGYGVMGPLAEAAISAALR